MTTFEFWPDHGGALLWTDGGERVSLDELPLPPDLVERARSWVADYDDAKLPWEPTRDEAWLGEGRRLFVDLRRALLERDIELEPNEEFWGRVRLGEDPQP
jgi:hypothetical protein